MCDFLKKKLCTQDGYHFRVINGCKTFIIILSGKSFINNRYYLKIASNILDHVSRENDTNSELSFLFKRCKRIQNTKKFLHLIHDLITIIFDKSEITYNKFYQDRATKRT